MDIILSIVYWFSGVLLAPLLVGIINRTKAFFGGHRGQPLLQPYFDLFKLMHKGAVYSRTTTWIFRMGPVLGLGIAMTVLSMVPAGGLSAMVSFHADFVCLFYALGLMRFFTVLAAMDTGSAFEGMGASREMQFSVLTEPVLFVGVAALAAATHQLSLSGIYGHIWSSDALRTGGPALLVAAVMLIVLLTENSRIPVDDPDTHLELTMIHEVMVLDHGGVDLAIIQYSAALKLWIFSGLLVGLAVPLRTGRPVPDLFIQIGGVFLTAVMVGIIESTMARLRLLRVRQLLVLSLALALTALFWVLR